MRQTAQALAPHHSIRQNAMTWLRSGWAIGLSVLSLALPAQADQITVFAAASLKGALDETAQAFSKNTGHQVAVSYAGSSVLARQIALGAPANVFISAHKDWMDVLQDEDRIVERSRKNIISNSLVLIAPTQSTLSPNDIDDLATYLDGSRLAMGLLNAVPAGIYGKSALQSLGQWDALAPMVAQTDNVRAALALVALGQAPLGIVYNSDALAEPKVKTVLYFSSGTHPEITYPAALISGRDTPAAQELLNWLSTHHAHETFIRHGFTAQKSP